MSSTGNAEAVGGGKLPVASGTSPRQSACKKWACDDASRGVQGLRSRNSIMNNVKIILSAVAALLLAELVPGPWSMFRGMSTEKATGLAAVAGGFIESLFSPLFWLLAIVFFGVFFAASRMGNKVGRILLFWTPTLFLSTLAALFTALIAALYFYARPS
jgi:hypothetical protein